MILTLETATLENGTYIWRFPKMRYTFCIQTCVLETPTYNGVFCYVNQGGDKDISQLICPPVFYPYTFDEEFDYFSILFSKYTTLVATELSIELTPV